MTLARGLVVPLTPEQRRNRALYLAGELELAALDVFVRKEGAPSFCPDLYYRLEYPNGGVDPTAPDPAARWKRTPKSPTTFRTLDCFAAQCWTQGYDRFQPVRAAHIWEGRLNCDSMLIEASTTARCFEIIPEPEEGCIVAYESKDYDHDGDRDRVGHTGTVVKVPPKWNPNDVACWKAMQVVEARGVSGRCNKRYDGLAFWGNDRHGVPKESKFLRVRMTP